MCEAGLEVGFWEIRNGEGGFRKLAGGWSAIGKLTSVLPVIHSELLGGAADEVVVAKHSYRISLFLRHPVTMSVV
jgi:hypothetical protein